MWAVGWFRLLLGKRLAFGTSGLRGAMGPGYCRMNDLVVIQVMVIFNDDLNDDLSYRLSSNFF